MTTEAKATPTPDEAENNTEAAAKGKDTQTAKTEDAPKFTQADVDRIAAKTREEEKAKAKAAKEKDDRERADKDDENQKKFEKLAGDRKARIDELEPLVERLTSIVSDLAAAGLKDLPDEVKDIAPAKYEGDKLMNAPEVLEWLPKGKALAEKLEGQSAKPGAGKDPKAVGMTPTELVANERQRLQRTGKYAL